ncbi:MAG: hypothetical protein SNJ73_07800, partial [Acetobacteraceae bacterium]
MTGGGGPRRIAARTLADPEATRHDAALVLEGGRIDRVTAAADADPDLLVLPALVNAHDHARPLRASSFGGAHRPLEVWLPRLALPAPLDPHPAATAALGRAALGGAGAVMVHYTRPQGPMSLPDEAAAVARAA